MILGGMRFQPFAVVELGGHQEQENRSDLHQARVTEALKVRPVRAVPSDLDNQDVTYVIIREHQQVSLLTPLSGDQHSTRRHLHDGRKIDWEQVRFYDLQKLGRFRSAVQVEIAKANTINGPPGVTGDRPHMGSLDPNGVIFAPSDLPKYVFCPLGKRRPRVV